MSKADRVAGIRLTQRQAKLGLALSQEINRCVMDGNGKALENVIDDYMALASQVNGGSQFGMASEGGGKWLLDQHCRCRNGIPHWGQDGEFPVIVHQVPVQVSFWWHRFSFPAFEFRRIWPGLFISDTGFQAHSINEYVAGVTVEQAVRLILGRRKLVPVVPLAQRVAR